MDDLVSAFKGLIPSKFVLPRKGGIWMVEEPEAENSLFEISGGASHAFSLDQKGCDVFPFFKSELQGVKSVNDALIVSKVDGENYIVAVEMKTSKKKVSEALMQIESGRKFIFWARELISLHGHFRTDGCRFFGVISLKPRKQIRKGVTSRSGGLPSPILSNLGSYHYFLLENHTRASIADLVKKIIETRGSCEKAA